jgi:hypothetical protein
LNFGCELILVFFAVVAALHEVMRRIQRDLDLEQVLLESSQSALTGLEKPDEKNT